MHDRDDDRRGTRRAERGRDEAAVLRAARAGDRDAFDLLARRTAPRLVGAAARILGDLAEAEEAAADALLKAFAALPALADGAAFAAWAHRIACRAAVDRLRARRARRARGGGAAAALEEVADRRPDARPPAARLADAERVAEVRREVERLPLAQRLALVLHVWEGLSYEDVAEILGTTYDSVRVSVAHARRRLRARFAAREGRAS